MDNDKNSTTEEIVSEPSSVEEPLLDMSSEENTAEKLAYFGTIANLIDFSASQEDIMKKIVEIAEVMGNGKINTLKK